MTRTGPGMRLFTKVVGGFTSSPAILLFVLSPMIAELLSGSSPPAAFFQPFGLALLLGLYGSGVVIIRELAFRWGRGWPAILTLGAAYGIIEEGLLVKSFFSPYWHDLGILASYGRWLGVNWVWAEGLIIYHSVFSISIPILLVTLIFQNRKSQPWVGKRTLLLLGFILAAETLFGLVFFPYSPPPLQYIVAIGIVVALFWWAKHQSFSLQASTMGHVPTALRFGLLGGLGTLVFFLIFWAGPYTDLPPILLMLIIIAWASIVALLLMRMSGNGSAWSDTHKLALAAGGLGFFIALAPLQELNRSPPKNMTGMTLVAIGFVAFLAWLTIRIRRNAQLVPENMFCANCGIALGPQGCYCHDRDISRE